MTQSHFFAKGDQLSQEGGVSWYYQSVRIAGLGPTSVNACSCTNVNTNRHVLIFWGSGQDGKTPLHLAAEAGNTEGVDFLLHQGADKTLLDWVSAS